MSHLFRNMIIYLNNLKSLEKNPGIQINMPSQSGPDTYIPLAVKSRNMRVQPD